MDGKGGGAPRSAAAAAAAGTSSSNSDDATSTGTRRCAHAQIYKGICLSCHQVVEDAPRAMFDAPRTLHGKVLPGGRYTHNRPRTPRRRCAFALKARWLTPFSFFSSFLVIPSIIHVTEEAKHEERHTNTRSLMQSKKLVLILDLDNTLVRSMTALFSPPSLFIRKPSQIQHLYKTNKQKYQKVHCTRDLTAGLMLDHPVLGRDLHKEMLGYEYACTRACMHACLLFPFLPHGRLYAIEDSKWPMGVFAVVHFSGLFLPAAGRFLLHARCEAREPQISHSFIFFLYRLIKHSSSGTDALKTNSNVPHFIKVSA